MPRKAARKQSPRRPCVRCAAVRIVRLAFIRVKFVTNHVELRNGLRVDRVR